MTQLSEDEFLALVDRQSLVASVNQELYRYARERNGFAIWRAYSLCRQAGAPIPEVILQCFDRMAAALGNAHNAPEIAAALEMDKRGPRGSALRHLQDGDRSFEIVSKVNFYMSIPRPMGKKEAFRRVASDYGTTAPAVAQTYRRWFKGPAKPRGSRKAMTLPKRPRGPFDIF